MNDIMKNIKERRSIRKYRSAPIAEEDLKAIIEAGLWAPSARNIQPWHVTVVIGQEKINAITSELKAAVKRMPDNPYASLIGTNSYTVNFGAPVFVIVSANPDASNMVQADCALVLQNIFLAAHSLGIGSCWVNQLGSACPEPGFRAFLNSLGVPESNTIYGCTALGYPEASASKAPARKEGTVNYVK